MFNQSQRNGNAINYSRVFYRSYDIASSEKKIDGSSTIFQPSERLEPRMTSARSSLILTPSIDTDIIYDINPVGCPICSKSYGMLPTGALINDLQMTFIQIKSMFDNIRAYNADELSGQLYHQQCNRSSVLRAQINIVYRLLDRACFLVDYLHLYMHSMIGYIHLINDNYRMQQFFDHSIQD
ncbi:hypothetical protein GJ496_008932 [Pomphorhynchus laevis]|nr:hypothetical protein GJ496_008932 [Pomphorhynchus laevis]